MTLDPDLPVNVLDELPLFTRPSADGLVPLQLGGVTEWLNFAANLLGPQVTLPVDILAQEEFGDVNAPVGLNAIMVAIDGLTNRIGLDDLVQTSDGEAFIPRNLRSAIETALPFYSEYRKYLGFVPNDPNRLAREGYTPDSESLWENISQGDLRGIADSLLRGPGAAGARGLGLGFQTPQDTKGASFNASDIVSDIRKRLARTG